MNLRQLAIPVPVPLDAVARKQTLGASLELCAELAGFALDKELSNELRVDKAQFSRWLSGAEGIVWPKFTNLMDHCGNDAPVLWMMHQRGYDLSSFRKRETETEQLLRETREALEAERVKTKILTEALHGRIS